MVVTSTATRRWRHACAGLGVTLACGLGAAAEPDRPPPAADGSSYHGELRDGLYHGRGRLVWPSGAEYEGEFRHGLLHGEGRLTRRSGEVYEGSFAYGEKHGRGRLTTAGGSVYEGEYRNGELEGLGTLHSSIGSVYEGEFRNGVFEGRGTYTYADGTVYSGDFRAGDFDGLGEYRWPDGDRYVGGMREGAFHGVGRIWRGEVEYVGGFARGDYEGFGRWSLGDEVFEGAFQAGNPVQGTHRDGAGKVYTGSFEDWSYAGQGTLTYADGRRYEGSFVGGEESGVGRLTWPQGGVYEGEFEGGRPHGQGIYTYPSGKVYEGTFAGGRFHGPGELRWKTDDGVEKVATGTWEKGEYVAGDMPELIAPAALDAERILVRQPELLERSLARVLPSRPGVVDLYFLGFGAWAEQDVFMKEVSFAEAVFTERFDAEGRSLVLVNHRETLETRPLATITNLEVALQGLAGRMDPEEDLLFVFLSSHGSEGHELETSLGNVPLNAIAPQTLDAAFEAAGIPWKVVVVSSCHSGGFIEPLADDRTVVMTASAPDRKSFGCSNEAEFTYFGAAFLRDALGETRDFVEAFEQAREAIHAREAEQGLEHSEPQIASAPPIERRLARWRAALDEIDVGPNDGETPAAPSP